MRYYLIPFLFCFIFCCLGKLWGQGNQLTGVVTDMKGQLLIGANLISRDAPEGNILTFSISDKDGSYQLRLAPDYDSLWVDVTHLTQNPRGQWISNQTQKFDWQLSSRTHDLPTMEVTQQAVIRRGDTLIFDVAQLRESSDENIEHVLKRIPGITVSPEGQISYQDLAISKFYVEGLDLLEGRYAIATRNLSIDAIRDIEILERHQPIRVLDSIIVPPNAAINIRLKSNITFTGAAEGGLGLSPALYDLHGTGFGFTRQQQFNIIGSANNIGKRWKDDYLNLYHDQNFTLPLLSPTLARVPFGLPTETYLDNQEYTGSVSLLRKVGERSQFKLNGFVVTDAVTYQGKNTTTFRDGNNMVRFAERLSAEQQINLINGRLLYEINRKSFYLNSTVEVEVNEDATQGHNLVNGAPVLEQFEQKELEVDGNFQAIVRRKRKAFQIWGNLNYQEQNVVLAVAPLIVTVPEIPLLTLDTAHQVARLTALTGEVYTSLATRKGKLRTSGRIGLEFERETLGSLLQTERPGADLLPTELFHNDTRQRILRPYLNQKIKRETDRHFWALTLPLSIDIFVYEDLPREGVLRQNLFVTKPDLSYSYRFPKGQFLTFSYGFSLDYQRNNQLFEGYILRRNRFFDRTAADVNRSRANQMSVNFRGNNLASTLRYQTYLNIDFITTDLLAETSFDTSGESQALVQERNTRESYFWNGKLEWSVGINTELRLDANYSLTNYPIVLNGSMSRQFYTHTGLKLQAEQVFSRSIFRIDPELVRNFSDLADLTQWQEKLVASYYQQLPDGWGATRLQYTYQVFRNTEKAVTTNLLNLSYERKVFNDSWELRLVARNLLGTESFQLLGIDVFTVTNSSFMLRPRQLFVSLKRSL